MIKPTKIEREFNYNGQKLPDPNPNLSVEKVREVFAVTYPELSTATLEGPVTIGGKQVFTFERAVGTKG